MYRVMENETKLIPVYLYHFDGYVRCDEMLKWLIRNRLTGREFLLWARIQFGASILEVARYILMRLDKEKETRAILLGRDIK